MSSELLIRPGHDDHLVIAEILGSAAPGGGLTPSPIARLVSDAHHAASRTDISETASDRGIPYLIDPLTYLWQGRVREEHPWANLPFGQAASIPPSAFNDPFERERVVVAAVDFQREHGATAIIPPYPYVESHEDPWFEIALDLVDRTAAYLSDAGVMLPIVPVLCFKVQSFATVAGLELGIDRFVEVCSRHNVAFIAALPSPAGGKDDGIAKTRWVFRTLLHLNNADVRVVAWRQGALGPSLVAAGLAGYETGLGTGEQMNVSSKRSQLKPRAESSGGGGGSDFVYIQLLNRSVRGRVARVLFDDPVLSVKVMCDDDSCCPSRSATLGDRRRSHVVRSRARHLRELDRQPHREWRLYQVAAEADQAATIAVQANRLLAANPPTEGKLQAHPKIGVKSFQSIATVARELSSL